MRKQALIQGIIRKVMGERCSDAEFERLKDGKNSGGLEYYYAFGMEVGKLALEAKGYPPQDSKDKILEYLRSVEGGEVSRSNLLRQFQSLNATQLTALLGDLYAEGIIAVEEGPRNKPGRIPTTIKLLENP